MAAAVVIVITACTACTSSVSSGPSPATAPPAAAPSSAAAGGATTVATSSRSVTPPTGASKGDAPSTTLASASTSLIDFSDKAAADGWTNQDDTVMGGVSASTASWSDGALVFAGTVSLKNNGGFSSIQSGPDDALGRYAATATSIALRARGDGKTYVLQLRVRGNDRVRYIQRFTTDADGERTYVLPVDGFAAVTFMLEPRPDAPPLDPAAVRQVAFYILDRQDGPFALRVRRIDALVDRS
jgi:Complex I intermediate-associated protein 30 (CIA30)